MSMHCANVLVVGSREVEPYDSERMTFVSARTRALATGVLRKNGFDLVIFNSAFSSDDEFVWIQRLLTARPFMPVVALVEYEQVPQTVEARLRASGVAAVLNTETDELRTWLQQWVTARSICL